MKGLRNFISLLVVIALTIVGIYTVCIFNASHFLTERSLTKTVKKVNLKEILSEDGKVTNGGVSDSTMDKIYNMADTMNISKEQVDLLVESSAVKEFAGNYLSNVAVYLTNGEEKNITGIELTEIIKNNIDRIAAENHFDENVKQNVVTGVERYANDIVTLIPSPKVITESIDTEQLKGIQALFSEKTKTNLIYSIIGLTLLLILLQFSWWKWLSWVSVSVAITGLVSGILGLIASPMIEGLLLDHNDVMLLSLLNHFTSALAINFYIIGGILIIISFIMISIYVNTKHHLKQKEAEEAKNKLQLQSEM